jgi:class 3 adenylate cyclase
MNPFSLVFAEEDLETAYFEHRFPELKRLTRRTLIVASLLYVVFGFLDPWIVPEVKENVWRIRILVSAYFGFTYMMTFTPAFKRITLVAMTSIGVLGGAGVLLMLMIADDTGAQLYYAGLILVMNGTFLMLGLPFVQGLGICLYILLAYELIAIGARATPLPVLVNNNFFLVGSLIIAGFTGYNLELYTRRSFCQTRIIETERAKSDSLLLNILPKEIAKTLKERNGTIADHFEEASILFADIVDFTPLSEQMTPAEMIELLNEMFSYFDSLVEEHDLEKIRTIGDNYMVTSGVPRPRPDHAQALARMALDMRNFASAPPALVNGQLQLRIGINSGPVVAGVIGHKKFQYDVWGSAVNTASRMETQGAPGKIQITQATYELVKEEFICEPRGSVTVKGIGAMDTWFLVDKRQAERWSARCSIQER